MTAQTELQASVASAAPVDRRRAIAAGAVGNFVEFFDWNIYAYMAPVFAAAYFQQSDPRVGLLMVFSVFALGVVTRPLGALVFGAYSDRFGRRNAISISILGMALGSLVIGLCPDYGSIGVAAPVILLLARLLQGICAGGEAGSASTYLVEFAGPGRRASIASFQQISTGCATLAALAASAAVAAALPRESLEAWGWRIPFLAGAAMGLFGLYLRLRAGETPVFEADAPAQARRFWLNLGSEWRGLLLVTGMAMFPSVAYLSWQIYFPTYLSTTAGFSRADSLTVSMAGVVVFLALMYPMARLSDRIGRRPMLLSFAVVGLLWSYPTYIGLPTFLASWTGALLVSIVGNIILAVMAGALVAAMAESFSTRVRATGFGLGYALAIVLTGGTFPPLATALATSGRYGWILAYVLAMGVASLAAYLLMPEGRDVSLTEGGRGDG